MQPGGVIESLLFSLLLLTFEGACAHTNTRRQSSPEKAYAVSADSTPLYYHSPRQGGGPSQILVRGTPVTLIRSSYEFCKVQLPGRERGFVASKDIAAAPLVVADVTTPPPSADASSSAWRAELPQPRSIAPPPPLPEFEPTPFPATINPRN